MNQKGNDYYETPEHIFKQLDDIFKFNLDVACLQENAKCYDYITESEDSLSQKWVGRCFCNPPFSKKAAFIEKAHNEVMNGNCVLVVMICRSIRWIQKFGISLLKTNFIMKFYKGVFLLLTQQRRNRKKVITAAL